MRRLRRPGRPLGPLTDENFPGTHTHRSRGVLAYSLCSFTQILIHETSRPYHSLKQTYIQTQTCACVYTCTYKHSISSTLYMLRPHWTRRDETSLLHCILTKSNLAMWKNMGCSLWMQGTSLTCSHILFSICFFTFLKSFVQSRSLPKPICDCFPNIHFHFGFMCLMWVHTFLLIGFGPFPNVQRVPTIIIFLKRSV